MRFTLGHHRVLIGHQVTVKVAAATGETVARVVSVLDGAKLGDDRLDPAEVQYERVFEQAGGAGPGQRHVLVVTATNDAGDRQTASRRWQDVV